jgi:MoxR-like ATPase
VRSSGWAEDAFVAEPWRPSGDVRPACSGDYDESRACDDVPRDDGKVGCTMTVWVVRGGRRGEFVDAALERGLTIIGWPTVETDASKLSQDEIRDILAASLPDPAPARVNQQAGQLYRFASVMQPGDLVIMPRGSVAKSPDSESESTVALGRVEGDYEYRTDIPGARHARAVMWLDPQVPAQMLSHVLRTALSGAVATVTRVTSLQAEAEVEALLGLRRDSSGLHLVLRWTRGDRVDTIEEHRHVAEAHGSVWWGKLGEPSARRPLSEGNMAILQAQLREGVPTYVYLYGMGTAWRTTLSDITLNEDEVASDRVPSYYGDAPHNLWLNLTDFQSVDVDWVLDHLVLRSDPTRRLRSAVGGQSSLFLVEEVQDVPPVPDRYFVLLQSEDRNGESLDEEGVRYVFDTSVAGQKKLREANGGKFVYYRPGRGASPATRRTFFGHGVIDRVEETERDGQQAFRAVLTHYQPFAKPVPATEYEPPRWNPQHSITEVTEDVFRELLRRAGGGSERATFDAAFVKRTAQSEPHLLQLDDDVYSSAVAALESGKHIVLTGPPGTAKTTLAQALGDAARAAGRCEDYVLTTATADWTTFETIGGLRPQSDNTLAFAYGHFLAALRGGRWLIIDELNRSNFDRAFGQLFTVLSGQSVVLPYEDKTTGAPVSIVMEGGSVPAGTTPVMVSRDWRLIATMNVFDKFLLFEMSYALMRRFAFIEVPAPADEVYASLISREASPNPQAAAVASSLLPLRAVKELGPALFMDLARYARERFEGGAMEEATVTFECFYSFLLPQFEGLDDVRGRQLFQSLAPLVPDRERLKSVLVSVLGLEPSRLSDPSGPGQSQAAADQLEG